MTIVDRRPIVPGVDLKSIQPKAPANVQMAVDVSRREIIDDIVTTMLAYAAQ